MLSGPGGDARANAINLPPESKTGGLTFSPAGRGSQEGSYFWGGSYFWVHPLCCHFTFPDTEDV